MPKMDTLTAMLSATLNPSGTPAPPTVNASGEISLLRTMPTPFTAFSFVHLLHHHGLLAPFISPDQYLGREDLRKCHVDSLLEHYGLSAGAEVWPLLQPLGFHRENADEIAHTRLPGYMFVSRLLSLDEDGFYSPVTLCTDTALAAAVVSRVKGRYYRSDAEPDYRMDHFLKTAVVCGDTRVFQSPETAKEGEVQ
ncbi:MAG: hypothetical protein BWY09_02454 [Candidatus Hydrogenedentes bacterium ADurb.Bin179]|nr:MAG: hypothetical protein BWY09_02454 [Candidatus Hydrogenedentes bacterium ADurb.Bin179]